MKNTDLKNYIETIFKIEKEKSLTEEDFISIAKEIGLTDEDLIYIDKLTKEHLKRGENYIEIAEYKKAIIEFKSASKLKPHNLEITFYLAKAYFNL
jgi:tetratricopeptide (TPR) repeat protein